MGSCNVILLHHAENKVLYIPCLPGMVKDPKNYENDENARQHSIPRAAMASAAAVSVSSWLVEAPVGPVSWAFSTACRLCHREYLFAVYAPAHTLHCVKYTCRCTCTEYFYASCMCTIAPA